MIIGRVARLTRTTRLSGQISVVAAGTIAAQAILFGSTTILARLYGPDEFGQFSITLSLSSILLILATMRLEAAVPLAGNEDDALQIARSAVVCTTVVSLGLTAALGLVHVTGGGLVRWTGIGGSLWLIPPTVFALGAWTSVRMWRGRHQEFARISRSTVTGSLVQSVAQILAGVSHVGAVGLSLGYIAGRMSNVVSLQRGAEPLFVRPRIGHLVTIRRFARFSTMTVVPGLLNTICVGAVAPYVALLYGLAFSGLAAFAMRVLALPAVLLGQAVSTVLYPRTAELERTGGDLSRTVRDAATALLMLGAAPFGTVLLFGPEIFALAFGPQWRPAGEIAVLLAPWLAASLISSPLSGIATIKRRFGRLLLLSVVETGARLGCLAAGLLNGRPMTGVAAYSICGLVISAYYIAWTLRLAGAGIGAWAREQRGYLLTMLSGYPLLLLTKGSLPWWAFVALASAFSCAMLLWAGRTLYRLRRGSPAVPGDPVLSAAGAVHKGL